MYSASVLLESVSKTFQPRSTLWSPFAPQQPRIHALRSVSLAANAGDVLVILGPNGSGKTTLLKLVATLLLPDAGRVQVDGQDTTRNADQVRQSVGFAIANERSFFPRLTGRENLDFFASLENIPGAIRAERIAAVLRATGLLDCADGQVMNFSSGMYQRLGIARALLKQPSVLLLDEPSRSLDPAAAGQLWEHIRRSAEDGVTVLLATHNFEEAATVGDFVAFLRRGELVKSQGIDRVSAPELRAWYFREMGLSPESACAPTGRGQ